MVFLLCSQAVKPYTKTTNGVTISRQKVLSSKRVEIESPLPEIPEDDDLNKWYNGPIAVNVSNNNLSCQECEEDINEPYHYP